MENLSIILFVGTLILLVGGIQIILIFINDAKVWSKLDRITNFFMTERNAILDSIKDIKSIVEKLEKK